MKPTFDQQKLLKKYLRKNLRYSETYEEFYDHILTALSAKYTDIPFWNAVDEIIEKDFGGFEGMATIEAKYHRETMREMKRRYLDYLAAYLKFPSVIILIVISILLYFYIKQRGLDFFSFFLLYIMMSLIPSLLNNIRYIKRGYFFRNINRSVKDDGFTWMKYIPRISIVIIGLVHYLFVRVTPDVWFKNIDPTVITIFFMVYGLHLMVYYKIFRDEYKVSIAG